LGVGGKTDAWMLIPSADRVNGGWVGGWASECALLACMMGPRLPLGLVLHSESSSPTAALLGEYMSSTMS
jgi:hypothetical protein